MNRKLMRSLCLVLVLALCTGCVRQTLPETTGHTTRTEATTEEGTLQGDTLPQSCPIPKENRSPMSVMFGGVASTISDGYFSATQALKFYDAKTGKTVFLCSQPGCTHSDSTCGAWIGQVNNLVEYGGVVYASVKNGETCAVVRKDIATGELTTLASWEDQENISYECSVGLCAYGQMLIFVRITEFVEDGVNYSQIDSEEQWLYNLTTGEKRKLDWEKGTDTVTILAMNQTYAVAEYYRNLEEKDPESGLFTEDYELRLYRFADDSYTVISSEKENGYRFSGDPARNYGDLVVFQEKDTLCLYDLEKQEKRELLTAENIINYWILDNKVFYIREEETPEPPAVSIYYADIETGQPVRLENGGNREGMDFAITWEGDSFFVGTWKGGNYIIPKRDFYLDNYEAARPGGY